MKKLSKLKLTNVDKKELEAKKMNLLRGGDMCYCTCTCIAACPCSGDPISNQNTTHSGWESMFHQGDANVDITSGHGPY
jgi:natural product precursor